MSTAVIVAALVLFAGLSGALIAWSVTHQPVGTLLRDRVRSTIVVTLKTGQTYRGVLLELDHHVLVLCSAEVLSADGEHLAVDGELLILRPDIAYMQRP